MLTFQLLGPEASRGFALVLLVAYLAAVLLGEVWRAATRARAAEPSEPGGEPRATARRSMPWRAVTDGCATTGCRSLRAVRCDGSAPDDPVLILGVLPGRFPLIAKGEYH